MPDPAGTCRRQLQHSPPHSAESAEKRNLAEGRYQEQKTYRRLGRELLGEILARGMSYGAIALACGAGLESPISTVNEGTTMGMFQAVMVLLRAMLIPKMHLAVENLALRQQLAVCKQSVKRPKLHPRDRVFWVWLSRLWPNWRSALAIV